MKSTYYFVVQTIAFIIEVQCSPPCPPSPPIETTCILLVRPHIICTTLDISNLEPHLQETISHVRPTTYPLQNRWFYKTGNKLSIEEY